MNPDGFLRDVLGEPEGLARVLDAYGAADGPLAPLGAGPLDGRRVVLIGMGSSRFAALTAASQLRGRGVAAVAEYASTAAPTPPGADVLAIAISASGSTPETVEALERHRGTSRTVAITNVPDGPLGAVADDVLPLLAGEEEGGVACRTFQATLAVLQLLSGVRARRLAPAVAAQEELLARSGTWAPELLDTLDGAHTVYAIAPAERLSSALQSALMLREGPRIPADATETGDWLHVDVYLTKHPGYRALLFPGSRFDPEVLRWAAERASTIVAVGRPVEGAAGCVPFDGADDPLVASLVEVSVAEVVAALWWQRRVAAGTMP
jgi:fructoselysine-6-P-deglycase FrlB-like protein